ncbi:MAG: hypothetical protein HQK54_06290 [Oligoflexales bacterium]|nr:hypothetical protein [Oligoflexales bacterium]
MTEPAKEGKKRKIPSESLDDDLETQDGRAGAQIIVGRKLKLTLSVDYDGPLAGFQNALKERGIKNIDIGDIVNEALTTIPQEWWDAKLNDLTPLEWKLQEALKRPEMRARLQSVLEDQL